MVDLPGNVPSLDLHGMPSIAHGFTEPAPVRVGHAEPTLPLPLADVNEFVEQEFLVGAAREVKRMAEEHRMAEGDADMGDG